MARQKLASSKKRKPEKTLSQAGSFAIGQSINLSIDRLAYHSGDGVGRASGFVIFVPNTCPGDTVKVRLTEVHPHFAKAELVQILVASPHRRDPVCPVFQRCGGCQWQHVSYEMQAQQKEQILKMALKKSLAPESPAWRPLIYGHEFHYRNRIQIQKQNQKLGFFAKGTNQIVEFGECLIAEPILNQTLKDRTAEILALDGLRVEIARAQNQQVQIRPTHKDPEQILFSQVNEEINQKMISQVLELSQSKNWEEIVELYSGSGNFTFQIAQAHSQAHLTAVEMSQKMVNLAQKQQKLLFPNVNIDWKAASTSDFLKDFCPKKSEWLLVLDPPRPGCDTFTKNWILEKRPHQIIYISCNPSTLARDIDHWIKDGHYEIEFARGFDMFPQTAHVEAVVSLIAKKV